ncbi:hypothetical protein SELMODRAFT_137499 [Selaginella moellendorffii]|uniref:non-specific serine/threonine protein kinase n=1 Tax=Selaginella moellendorffii TaxID=88036 RepID=D8TDQ2_SELML|nr:hypothetical protein SELMODRAFT_137499 [Selaginella moellendorffii]
MSYRRTRVGKYELGRTLGEGTFAKVKYARNLETNESVAIKILDKEKILKHKMVDQIKREISTMKLVRHPNVIQLFEVIGSKTKIYMVMEYVTGGEMFDKIAREGKQDERKARIYFQQLIDAVDYCHSRGVCHRDLKPENLLLDSDGNLKISDFGLSALPQQCRSDGLLHTTCGTPNYVAPEVISDKGYDGFKADIWSCGIVLYVLLAGYLPFDEPNLVALYKKMHRADFTFPHWFSRGSRKLVQKILDPNPKSRISISRIMDNEWFQVEHKPMTLGKEQSPNLDDIDAVFNGSEDHLVAEKEEPQPVTMNAFEIISMSRGFNLSGLFEHREVERESRFTSKHPAKEIVRTIEETARPLGFHIQKRNYKMTLQGSKRGRKGHLSVCTEVFEVAPSFYVVELRKSGGDTLEYHKATFHQSFTTGLKDIIWKDQT